MPAEERLMEHFVQYRNPDLWGHEIRACGPLQVYTTKSVTRLPGNTIWLIAGEGRPRRYSIAAVFVVDEVGPADDRRFRSFARGTQGTRFVPPIPLSEEAWFPALRRRLASFSLGLCALPEEFLPYLQDICSREHVDGAQG
jgi:hypothetical protein